MGEVVNIGFIGCGGNARAHLQRLKLLPEVRVIGACDVAEENARRIAVETGAEVYTDHRRLLDDPRLTAVYISLPVFAHGRPEFDVIERGLPFLVEKPVALDMETGREIARRVRERNILTAVGYQLRYSGSTDMALELLGGKRIGLVSGRYWCGSGAGDPEHWILQMGKSGGQIVEQATHTVDMMRYLAGEIVEVYCASASRVISAIDCPDFSAVTVKFADGAVGSLTTSWACTQGWSNANVLDVLYEDALLNWTYTKLTVHRDGKTEQHTLPTPTVDSAFVHAVKTGDRSGIRSDYEDALTTLAVTLAMNRSAREGRPVRVCEVG